MSEGRGPGRKVAAGVTYYPPWKPRPIRTPGEVYRSGGRYKTRDSSPFSPPTDPPRRPNPLAAEDTFRLDMWAARQAYLSGAIEADVMDRAMSAAYAHAGA